jgi:hypothetical protein
VLGFKSIEPPHYAFSCYRNIKDIDAYDDIEKFLGDGIQTDINPSTGKKDLNRIFVKQKDGFVDQSESVNMRHEIPITNIII